MWINRLVYPQKQPLKIGLYTELSTMKQSYAP